MRPVFLVWPNRGEFLYWTSKLGVQFGHRPLFRGSRRTRRLWRRPGHCQCPGFFMSACSSRVPSLSELVWLPAPERSLCAAPGACRESILRRVFRCFGREGRLSESAGGVCVRSVLWRRTKWLSGCWRRRVGGHGGETRLFEPSGAYHKTWRPQQAYWHAEVRKAARSCGRAGWGIERAERGRGAPWAWSRKGERGAGELAWPGGEARSRQPAAGRGARGPESPRAWRSVDSLDASCSWCSTLGPVLERADTSPLWRMSAFCLTGPGEGPKLAVDFVPPPWGRPCPGPVKSEKARTPASARASSCPHDRGWDPTSRNRCLCRVCGPAGTRSGLARHTRVRRAAWASSPSGHPAQKLRGRQNAQAFCQAVQGVSVGGVWLVHVGAAETRIGNPSRA